MRNIGYTPLRESYVKRLGQGDYPRFHAYIKQAGGKLIINLHLDQKKPIYKGVSAHSGEYVGELVEKEAERIKNARIGEP
ncbi:MAG: hypothetical protein HYW70_00165 [Candidatus Nealsonbacteria bacterium]|nr:hypothetical protein [Candidatus Nealsonbacteria bacterium]